MRQMWEPRAVATVPLGARIAAAQRHERSCCERMVLLHVFQNLVTSARQRGPLSGSILRQEPRSALCRPNPHGAKSRREGPLAAGQTTPPKKVPERQCTDLASTRQDPAWLPIRVPRRAQSPHQRHSASLSRDLTPTQPQQHWQHSHPNLASTQAARWIRYLCSSCPGAACDLPRRDHFSKA